MLTQRNCHLCRFTGYQVFPITQPASLNDDDDFITLPEDWNISPNDVKRNCPCGKDDHKAIRDNIICIGCGCYVHKDCLRGYREDAIELNITRLTKNYYGPYRDDDDSDTLDPLLTLCPRCADDDHHFQGHCCALISPMTMPRA